MVQLLTNEINKRMVYPEDHPFRLLRRCPYCDTIWLKVIGCEDTYCGNRLVKRDEKFLIQTQPIYNQYKFDYVNNQQKKIDYKQIVQNHDKDQSFRQAQIIKLLNQDIKNSGLLQEIEFFYLLSEESQFEQLSNSDSQQTQDCSSRSSLNIRKVNQKAQTVDPLRKKIKLLFLENQQSEQIQKYGQIGCGKQFDWDSAPLVNIDDIDLNQKEIIALFTNKDNMYKEEYKLFKNEQLRQALLNKKNL